MQSILPVTLACAWECIHFGLRCSGVSARLTAAAVNVTALVWSFIRVCAVKWMQGSPEVSRLCGCSAENDSAGKKTLRTALYGRFYFPSLFLFFFLISFCSFNLLRSPAACLVLLFCCFIATFYLTAFILCIHPFYFSLPIPSSCTPTPPPSNNPSDRRFPGMQGFDAASGLSEGFSDTTAKYTRGSTEPKRFFAIFMGATVRFSGLIFLS